MENLLLQNIEKDEMSIEQERKEREARKILMLKRMSKLCSRVREKKIGMRESKIF